MATEAVVILLAPNAGYEAHEALIACRTISENEDSGTVAESAEQLAEFLTKYAAFGFTSNLVRLLGG